MCSSKLPAFKRVLSSAPTTSDTFETPSADYLYSFPRIAFTSRDTLGVIAFVAIMLVFQGER
jgi:hypothetical protein